MSIMYTHSTLILKKAIRDTFLKPKSAPYNRSGLYSLVFHFFGAGYLEIGLIADYWRI